VTCDDEHCADCNEEVGGCDRCKVGYYLDKSSAEQRECFPCSGSCRACDDAYTCNECESKGSMHYPKDPSADGCECNAEQGWVQIPDRLFSCYCTSGFVDANGFCVSCDQLYDGCSACVQTLEPEQNAVYVGTHDVMPGQLPYVTCEACEHPT